MSKIATFDVKIPRKIFDFKGLKFCYSHETPEIIGV